MRKLTRINATPFLILAALAIVAVFIPSLPNFIGDGKYNSADIAWLIVATALVFLMTPGLAFFYGGMDENYLQGAMVAQKVKSQNSKLKTGPCEFV